MRVALLGLLVLVGCSAAPTAASPTTTTTSAVVVTTTTSTSAPPATTTTEVARSAPRVPPPGIWDLIANCESGGRWDDTRDGYEGGVHFLHSTWVAAGGRRFAEHAYQATRGQQIEIAQAWLKRTSWEQWPVCSRKVGAR